MKPAVPLVGPLERTLHLQSLSMFEGVRSAQVAHLARLLNEEYVPAGAVLFREGEPAARVHFIVEGSIENRRGGRVIQVQTGPDAAGLHGLLGGAAAAVEGVARTELTTLTIDGNAFLDLIEDHFDMFLHFRGLFAERVASLQKSTAVYNTDYGVVLPDALPEPRGVVERLLYLRQAPVFDDASVNALAQMIHRKDDYRANPGDEIWREAEPGRFLLFVMRGEVECTTADGRGDFRAGPGYVVGADATFGAIPYAYTARVSKPLVALRVDAAVLNDIQEDHFDFALGTLAHFSREEIRLLAKRAR